MSEYVWCYVAVNHGMPGFCALVVDSPEDVRDTAKTIAGWVRDGLTVERVTLDRGREGLTEYVAAKRAAGGEA